MEENPEGGSEAEVIFWTQKICVTLFSKIVTSGQFYTCNVLQLVPTCLEGHPLKLGTAIGGSGRYNCNMCRVNIEQSQIFPQKYLKICRIIFTLQGSFTQQSSSWRCQEDFRRGGGNCNFDLCVPCMKTLGVTLNFVKITNST